MKIKTLTTIILILILALSIQNCSSGSAQAEAISKPDTILYLADVPQPTDSMLSFTDTVKKATLKKEINPVEVDSLAKLKFKRDSIMHLIKENKSSLQHQNKTMDSLIMLKTKKSRKIK